jgi:hypothetical protein
MIIASRVGNIPGLEPPPVLIFFHIPKTGGTTMNSILRRCLRSKNLNVGLGSESPDTALWSYSTKSVMNKYWQLLAETRCDIRCISGEHVTYDICTSLGKPSKFLQ